MLELAGQVSRFAPDMIVVTTAPSYLFWRCAPPELRVPQLTLAALAGIAEMTVAVGPHGSTTPRATLRKLGVDAVIMGECEEVLLSLAETPRWRWSEIAGLCRRDGGDIVIQGGPQAADMARLPALRWPEETLRRHAHHHHRFDRPPSGPGAEMEVSRGCPYRCTFCAKENFRDRYRRRPLATILDELDGLIAAGVTYVYFIDEIFLPWRELLEELATRPVEFGVQTRIDLWRPDMLDLLGRAGCVSIEAGVESLNADERNRLDKDCRLSTDELTDRLIQAKRSVPFVQANLIASGGDDPQAVARWRDTLRARGVWANEPVPLFPYPGLAGLPPPVGVARRRRLGAGARLVSRPLRSVQRHSGGAAAAPRRTGAGVMGDGKCPPLTVLMTADAVGGVWHYALDLCAALPAIRFVLAVMGPMPSAAQREAAGRLDNVILEEYGHRLEWMQGAAAQLAPSRHWLTLLARRYRADLLHVNGYAHARNNTGLPTLAVAHSDVLSWWRAVHGEAAPPRVAAVPAGSRLPGCAPPTGSSRRPPPCSTIWRGNTGLIRRNGHRHPERNRHRVLCAATEARRDHGGRQIVGRGEEPRHARRGRRRYRLADRYRRRGQPSRGRSGALAGGARLGCADPGRDGRAARGNRDLRGAGAVRTVRPRHSRSRRQRLRAGAGRHPVPA